MFCVSRFEATVLWWHTQIWYHYCQYIEDTIVLYWSLTLFYSQPAGSQISQKLKLTYKTSTSKIVSSFRAAPPAYQLERDFRGHRDGVWEVSVSPSEPHVIGTASAGGNQVLLSLFLLPMCCHHFVHDSIIIDWYNLLQRKTFNNWRIHLCHSGFASVDWVTNKGQWQW